MRGYLKRLKLAFFNGATHVKGQPIDRAAYEEAYALGESAATNPYPAGTLKHASWKRGREALG